MDRYRITLGNHLNNASLIVLTLLISLLFPYVMSWIKNENVSRFLDIGVFIFCVLAVPALVIHVNYYLVNRGDIFEYSDQRREVTICHKGVITAFHLDEIAYIERSMSWNMAAKRSIISPWESYNHSNIYLKDGKRFTITSLLVPDLDLPLGKEKITVKKNFYRLATAY